MEREACSLFVDRGEARFTSRAPHLHSATPRGAVEGAAGAERSELALDGAAARVASRRRHLDHAADPITRKREDPAFESDRSFLTAAHSDLKRIVATFPERAIGT
jgi:hypothetical protein